MTDFLTGNQKALLEELTTGDGRFVAFNDGGETACVREPSGERVKGGREYKRVTLGSLLQSGVLGLMPHPLGTGTAFGLPDEPGDHSNDDEEMAKMALSAFVVATSSALEVLYRALPDDIDLDDIDADSLSTLEKQALIAMALFRVAVAGSACYVNETGAEIGSPVAIPELVKVLFDEKAANMTLLDAMEATMTLNRLARQIGMDPDEGVS